VASQGTEAALFGLFWPGIPTKSALGAPLEPLFRQFHGEVRLIPGPMGEDFSGSCTVTSRNPLIQIGATNGTKSERFDAKRVSPCCSRVLGDAPDGSFATLNFAEFIFF
jgi:hypothetical protein